MDDIRLSSEKMRTHCNCTLSPFVRNLVTIFRLSSLFASPSCSSSSPPSPLGFIVSDTESVCTSPLNYRIYIPISHHQLLLLLLPVPSCHWTTTMAIRNSLCCAALPCHISKLLHCALKLHPWLGAPMPSLTS